MLATGRRFQLERDAFAFPNELVWEYHFDPATATTVFSRRQPPPDYVHRCFVLVRAARQFLYHARFDPEAPPASDAAYRRIIRAVLDRDERQPPSGDGRVVVPGFSGLRELSRARTALLKEECGGAWRSYVMRSHWRIVVPVMRRHQHRRRHRVPGVRSQRSGAAGPPHLRSRAPHLLAARQSLLARRRPEHLRDLPRLVPVD